jgi:hypothetical protein
MDLEAGRIAELREAQNKAEQLFDEIERRSLIRPGITEGAVNEEVFALANRCSESKRTTFYFSISDLSSRSGRPTLAEPSFLLPIR